MAVSSSLRVKFELGRMEDSLPDEQELQSALVNLTRRFPSVNPALVADILKEKQGHAGRTAQELKKLSSVENESTGATAALGSNAKIKAQRTLPCENGKASGSRAPAHAQEEGDALQQRRPSSVSTGVSSGEEAEDHAANLTTPPEDVDIAEEEDCRVDLPPPEVVQEELVAGPYSPARGASLSRAPPSEAEKLAPDSMLLFLAALQGDVQRLNWLINQGVDMDARYTGQPLKAKADRIIEATVLHLVVAMGLTSSAEVLLRHGVEIDAKMQRSLGAEPTPREQYADMTALHLAAMEGHTKIVEMLLARGADKYARMQVIEKCSSAQPGSRDKVGKLSASMSKERFITPMEIAYEMKLKGHHRDSVLSVLNNWK